METLKKEDWVKDYLTTRKKEEQEIEKLMSDSSYIDWLSEYIGNRNAFSDEFYYLEDSNSYENEKIRQLHLFYEGIERYANQNEICPIQEETNFQYSVDHYNIKYNDTGIEIGVLVNLEVIYYCIKVPLSEDMSFIDFNDILNSKKENPQLKLLKK